MNRHFHSKIGQGLLAMALLAGMLLPYHSDAIAAGGLISKVVPGSEFIEALIARGKTYANAEEFISDRNGVNDDNRTALRQRFAAYIHARLTGDPNAPKISEIRPNQVAAYVIEASLIESERKTALDFAESVKKGAKRQFDQALMHEIQDRVMAPGMIQKVFTAFTNGLGAEQQLVDLLSGKMDQLPAVDLQLRQLRSLSDNLRLSAALFHSPEIDDLSSKLNDLSTKIRGGAHLDQGDLDDIKGQISGVKSKLESLSSSSQLPALDTEAVDNLGMLLLGNTSGTTATQAMLNLLANQSGLSYEQIRKAGLAALESGFKLRCQQKVDAIQKALQALAEEQGVEIKIRPPSALCDEVNGAKLLNQAALKASSNPSLKGDNQTFSEDSCACGDFKVKQALAADNGLDCYYEWTGASGVVSNLSYEVSLYYPQHLDELQPGYDHYLSDIKNKMSDVQPPQIVNTFLEDNLDLGMVITGPGGVSETNKPLPMCGNGNGTYHYGDNYLISTRLFGCDFGDQAQGYIDAMQQLAACAMASIEGRYP